MAPRRGLWPLGRGSWPQRKPGRKSDFGVSFESSSGLPRRSIVNFVQLRPKLTILRRLKAKTHDYLRHRKAHARTTDKNVHFSLPRPRKTVCFDRQRPKTTVFRIAHLRVRIVALQGGGHGPPGRRGSRHRSGKTTQNWEARPRAKVVAPISSIISARLLRVVPRTRARRQSERRSAGAKVMSPARGAAPGRESCPGRTRSAGARPKRHSGVRDGLRPARRGVAPSPTGMTSPAYAARLCRCLKQAAARPQTQSGPGVCRGPICFAPPKATQ